MIYLSSEVIEYNSEVLLGIQHWRGCWKLYYTGNLNFKSKEKVYHESHIVSIMEIHDKAKWDYTFMKLIFVKRQDERLYKFSKADIPDLNMNDIEDMYLEKIERRMQHYTWELQYNFISALLLYIRRLIIQERVEYLQLGVESYQRQLNLIKPQLSFPGIHLAS